MSLIVRKALENDIPEILEINNYEILNSTVNYDYEPKSLEFQLDWFHQKSSAGLPIIVAEKDGKVIGFATFGPFRPKPSYQFTIEHSVYIHPDFRGAGVGKRLMEKLISIAKNKGFHLMVGGIDANNLNSLEFHKKLGFQEVGKFLEVGRKFDQWLDLIFVQLPLG
ncbi:N-acetyltransferase [Algoriphagus aestuarii]|nr:N-acetyltransferase [Algoriphagus aestuarii]